MPDRDKKYMEFMAREATDLEGCAGARVAAILVYRDKPIAIGYNHKKSHPFIANFTKNDQAIFFHAETHAIFKALRSVEQKVLQRSTLYICRVKYAPDGRKKGQLLWGLAKPCRGCMSCIAYYNIPRIVYSTDGEPGSYKVMEK